MAEPITHLEQTIAGQVEPVTHLEQVIAEYGGGDINEQLEAGTNIVIEPTADGKAKISASGEVSSEDTYARGEISDHKADKANPHEVTAAQVGLGNVNNTSDANKPVSTATQAALDLKANLTDIPTVNDATITIQKNGTKVDDFTLNAASGKNINITVPTTAADVSALPASTKYAGASTAGGSATSAAKLDTASAGSTTQPVYFANGVPTATGYSVAKNVPADAVFTDTTYTFEGTYNASTNKAATMADIKDGKLTGYAQGSGNVAATDKVIEAIGKVEKKADDNTTNISTAYGGMVRKNRLNYDLSTLKTLNASTTWVGTTGTTNRGQTIVYDPTDNSLTVSGNGATETAYFNLDTSLTLPEGTYRLYGCPEGGSSSTYELQAVVGGVDWHDYGNGVGFIVSAPIGIVLTLRGGNYSNIKFTPIVCTIADYDADDTHAYQPYIMTNDEISAAIREIIANQ